MKLFLHEFDVDMHNKIRYYLQHVELFVGYSIRYTCSLVDTVKKTFT